MSHATAEVVERLFGGFGRDPFVVARTLADDVVWRVPGDNAMSGEYVGRDAVLKFLRNTFVLTDHTYKSSLEYVTANDTRAVAVYRARGTRNGRALDIEQALFCEIRDGQITDVTAIPFDFAAFDTFWA